MTYLAFISPVKIRPHPNADNIQLGLIRGNQVVIGKEIVDQQLMVYFPSDGQLSEEFCNEHDLVAIFDPVTKKKINGGYFSDNRRVKTQNFRGEKSDGFAMPLDCLKFTGVNISTLVDGFEFDTINGIKICQKYYTPATLRQANNIQPKKKNVMFAEHVDTEQLDRNLDFIEPLSHIVITGKIHGTSGRIGNVMVDKQLNPLQRLWNKISFLPKYPEKEWKVIHGSRRVILGDKLSNDGYYNSNFREQACGWLEPHLRKGEVIYLEIVGWVDENTPIMNPHNVEMLKNKEMVQKYGKIMHYTYGTERGQQKIFVYRITQVNEDGQAVELSWYDVKKRCNELGIQHVWEHYDFIYVKKNNDWLLEAAEMFCEGSDPLDQRHIREGVVFRVENDRGIKFYKYKSFEFRLMEGIVKDDETVVDIEESS